MASNYNRRSNYSRRRYYSPSLSTQLRGSYENNRNLWDKAIALQNDLKTTQAERDEWKNLCQMFYLDYQNALIAAGMSVDDNPLIQRYREMLAGPETPPEEQE